MAAAPLASDLNLALYRVDLRRVVSKYIGETEKNRTRKGRLLYSIGLTVKN